LRNRLLELSPRQREVVLLHAAGWRYRELAERLGLTEDVAHQLLAEGNRKMRRSSRRLADR